jgi:adenine deaminase
MDRTIRRAMTEGRFPLMVHCAASLSAAGAFWLRDRGPIAPGKRADIPVRDSIEGCRAQLVREGGVVADAAAFHARDPVAPVGRASGKGPSAAT